MEAGCANSLETYWCNGLQVGNDVLQVHDVILQAQLLLCPLLGSFLPSILFSLSVEQFMSNWSGMTFAGVGVR